MPFGLKDVLPTYQWVVKMVFREYLGTFMKLFLDDFNVFNDQKIILTNFNYVLISVENSILA
jgi:hypothetical protein